MSTEQILTQTILEWKEGQMKQLDWRQRYYTLRDETDQLLFSNEELRRQLARPASEEIECLKLQVSDLNLKCAALLDALDASKR